MQFQRPQGKANKKLQQFLDEVNETFSEWRKRYQYSLTPILKYSPKGITPDWSVEQVVPPKKKSVKKTAKKKN
ncbi:MAG TPA: hypothetical protein ENI23_16715 [bacterium]|nr:hypothetical protein [bacterium]